MYENFPYSNFHDLNTDWIVKKIKDVETSEANAKESEENAKASELASAESAEQAHASELNSEASALASANSATESANSATEADNYVTSTRAQVNLLQSRVDNIIPDGTQTEGNTELLDIRVGYNGVTYSSAGNAVRGQVSDVASTLGTDLENSYADYTVPVWSQGRISNAGSAVASDTTAIYSTTSSGHTDLQANAKDYAFYLDAPAGYTVQVFEYSGTSWASFVRQAMTVTLLPCLFIPEADKYYRFVLKRSAGGAFSPADAPSFKACKIEKNSVINNMLTDLDDNVDMLNSQMDDIREYTSNINTVGQGRWYARSNGTIGASSENYIGMPSKVPCEENTKYSVTIFDSETTTACGFYVCFYDTNGELIGTRLNVNTTAGYAVFESPTGGVNINVSVYNGSGISENAKITVIKGETKARSYLPPVTATDLVARNLTETANRMIENCNAKLNKKIITWIDDDTGLTAIPTVKSMCDTLGIKCTFACITNRLNNPDLVTLLKSYQEAGFHITCHSHTHGTWYESNPYNAQQIENDLVISLEALNSNGFLDSDMLVYPGSSPSRTDVDVVGIVKKWCKCGVKASGTNFTGYGDGEYLINRVFFDASEHDAQYYEDILDQYTNGNAPWVVFGSHSSNDTQFNQTMINTVLQYALTNGWVFMTLNEALKYRQKYFDIQEQFSL